MSDEAFFYPPLDAQTIRNLEVVRQLAKQHPSYWLTSPYPGEVEMKCREWFEGKASTREPVQEEPGNAQDVDIGDGADAEFLYREAKYLFSQLKTAGVGLEGTEKMSYFRVSANLLERLLGMQERANNLKQVSEFYQAVLDIMEQTLEPDQREQVLNQLGALVKGDL